MASGWLRTRASCATRGTPSQAPHAHFTWQASDRWAEGFNASYSGIGATSSSRCRSNGAAQRLRASQPDTEASRCRSAGLKLWSGPLTATAKPMLRPLGARRRH